MNTPHTLTAAALGMVLALTMSGTAPAQADRFRELREQMVREYIQREGVTDPRVLQAMRSVPRHEFMRALDRQKGYMDGAFPIGHGQTISPPFIVAYMTETIDPQPDERVLEIGTGSGYQAAVLSGLVKEVYTIEIVEPLGRQAALRLRRLGYDNVTVKVGDGYEGWPEHAPFDKIIVTCSPESVPQPLVDQLKEGGRMLIPLGERYQQVFWLYEKQDGQLVRQKLIPTLFVPMTGQSEEERRVRPDPQNPRLVNGGFEASTRDDGGPDNWHYQRLATLVSGDAPEGERFIRFENFETGRIGQMLQGIGVDGSRITALRFTARIKRENVSSGRESWEQPGVAVHFFDSVRRPIHQSALIGPWTGTSDWTRVTGEIKVPPTAREAVVRIGLNGGTGRLSLDDLQMEPVSR